MTEILWSPLALARVRETAERIARDRPRAAERWVVRIFDSVKPLTTSPKRGRVVPEAGREEIRELLCGKYRIIYKLEEDSISVLTIRHCSRLFDLKEIED